MIRFVFFGKPSKLASAEQDNYLKRIRAWRKVEVIELKESKQKNIPQRLAEEYHAFCKRIPNPGILVVLDEKGKNFTSVDLARWIETAEQNFQQDITFLIGSAYGLDDQFRRKGKLLLSLSPMTLTHDHARILLIEQVYRALCIQNNHPYHHV